jgi:uncharacterized protein (DUF2336 family)
MIIDMAFLNEIAGAIDNSTPARRQEMLRRVTDLFIVGAPNYGEEEVALFDDVICRLAAEIELSARALLAVQLAPIPNAPRKVVRQLAFDDEIDVAAPILTRSERLDEPALVENAKTKSQDHLLAISRRRTLSEAVTDVLVERGDRQVLLSTVENHGAQFSEGGFAVLVRRSEGHEGLTWCVGSRAEIPPALFLKLLDQASGAARARLEAAFPTRIREVRQAVAAAADRIRERSQAQGVERDYSAAIAKVTPLAESGRLDDGKVGEFARARAFEETLAAIAIMSDLPVSFVEQAMHEKKSETILVISKVIGLSWNTVRAVLSLRSGPLGMTAEEASQNLAHFGRLKSTTANEIVGFYRKRVQAEAAKHAPPSGTKRPN